METSFLLLVLMLAPCVWVPIVAVHVDVRAAPAGVVPFPIFIVPVSRDDVMFGTNSAPNVPQFIMPGQRIIVAYLLYVGKHSPTGSKMGMVPFFPGTSLGVIPPDAKKASFMSVPRAPRSRSLI